jgi:hypothetical protein
MAPRGVRGSRIRTTQARGGPFANGRSRAALAGRTSTGGAGDCATNSRVAGITSSLPVGTVVATAAAQLSGQVQHSLFDSSCVDVSAGEPCWCAAGSPAGSAAAGECLAQTCSAAGSIWTAKTHRAMRAPRVRQREERFRIASIYTRQRLLLDLSLRLQLLLTDRPELVPRTPLRELRGLGHPISDRQVELHVLHRS